MSDPGVQSSDPHRRTEQLIAEIRGKVAQRLATGRYSEETAAGLAAEPGYLRRLQPARGELSFEFERALADIRQAIHFRPFSRATTSRVPGLSFARRALRKLTAPDFENVYRQLDQPLRRLHDAASLLQQQIDAIEPPLVAAAADRQTQIDDALVELRRAESLLRSRAHWADEPLGFSYRAFEDRFRGSETEIRDRSRDLMPEFVELAPVVDLGSGRGEILDLLREQEIECLGVEIDREMVELCISRGHTVIHDDVIAYLERTAHGSLGAVVSFQVIEHLSISQAAAMIRLAFDVLRPGGLLMVETLNPRSLGIFSGALYLDPTHLKPVHPDYLDFLAHDAGFSEVEIRGRSFAPKAALIDLDVVDDPGIRRNFEQLNSILFAPADYLLVARK